MCQNGIEAHRIVLVTQKENSSFRPWQCNFDDRSWKLAGDNFVPFVIFTSTEMINKALIIVHTTSHDCSQMIAKGQGFSYQITPSHFHGSFISCCWLVLNSVLKGSLKLVFWSRVQCHFNTKTIFIEDSWGVAMFYSLTIMVDP